MTRILDFIFSNLEEKALDRSQMVAYIRYLEELIADGLPIEKELFYQGVKLQLTKRLNDLNQQQVQYYQQNKADKGRKEELETRYKR
jgi:GTP-dependent phosphoenolpyruvate carboxykinase